MNSLPKSFVDPACERELLAACIANPNSAPLAAERLTAERFGVPFHGKIFKAICAILADGKQLDEFAVDRKLSGDPEYGSLGELQFLVELTGSTIPISRPGAVEALAESVLENSLRRSVQQTVKVADQRLEDPLHNLSDLIVDLREGITQIEDQSELAQRGMVHVAEVTRELAPTLSRLSRNFLRR